MRPPRENRERAPRKERAPREPREDGAPATREGRERRERPPRERRERAPRVEQDGESSGLQVSFYDNPFVQGQGVVYRRRNRLLVIIPVRSPVCTRSNCKE